MKSINLCLFKAEGSLEAFKAQYGVDSLEDVLSPVEFSIALVNESLYCIIEDQWREVAKIIVTDEEEIKFSICDFDCFFKYFEKFKEIYPLSVEAPENGTLAFTDSSIFIYVDSWKKVASYTISDDASIPEGGDTPSVPVPPEEVEKQETITEIPPTNKVTFNGATTNYMIIDPKAQAARPELHHFDIEFEGLKLFQTVYIRVNCPDTMYNIDGTSADSLSLTTGGSDFTNALYRITKIPGSNYVELLEFTSLS